MELSNYQAFMECMRKWEKIGCNILCGLALWEQMQDCDRRGVPYTDIDIEAVSQDVAYRLTGIQQTNLAVGDTIRLGDKIVRVVGLTDTPVIINNAGFTNGVQIIVNGELYSHLLGDDSYSEIYPTLKENADADAFESWLDNRRSFSFLCFAVKIFLVAVSIFSHCNKDINI